MKPDEKALYVGGAPGLIGDGDASFDCVPELRSASPAGVVDKVMLAQWRGGRTRYISFFYPFESRDASQTSKTAVLALQKATFAVTFQP